MIPPRPWELRAEWDGDRPREGRAVIVEGPPNHPPLAVDLRDRAVAGLIVRMVNAGPEIVAALEAAEEALDKHGGHRYGADDRRTCGAFHRRACTCGLDDTKAAVRAALAKVQR